MRKFKSLKEEMLEHMFKKSGFVSRLQNDGTKYGSIDINALVQNDVLGVISVGKVRELEEAGAIVWQDRVWKIKTDPLRIDSSNIDQFARGTKHIGQVIQVPAKEWNDYANRVNYDTQKKMEEDRDFGQLALETDKI